MESKFFILMAIIICNIFLVSCDGRSDEPSVSVVPHADIKQVDMSVMVPIHPSSLQYFDYVIRYTDNRGNEQKDTIQSRNGGITVDPNEVSHVKARAALPNNHCYVKTYTYDVPPVACSVIVEMIPKKDGDCVASFMFYVPKPYIFTYICYSPDSIIKDNITIEGLECIQIDSMTINTFRYVYGSIFSSSCSVIDSAEKGYEVIYY